MEEANITAWLIPVWTIAVAVGIGLWGARKPWRRGTAGIAATLGVLSTVPILPGGQAQPSHKPARQVVYRFDGYRHIELLGHGCIGASYFVDTAKGIRTELMPHSGRISFQRFVHPDNGDFLFIPYHSFSAFMVSKDG